MPSTNTLPSGKTSEALGRPADFSRAGFLLPIVDTTPTDGMFGDGVAQDGLMVIEHKTGDGGGAIWVRLDGSWVVFAMAPL